MPLFFTSAADGTNVVKIFREILEAALEYKMNPPDKYEAELMDLLNDVLLIKLFLMLTIYSKSFSINLKNQRIRDRINDLSSFQEFQENVCIEPLKYLFHYFQFSVILKKVKKIIIKKQQKLNLNKYYISKLGVKIISTFAKLTKFRIFKF